jgi:hypothetical protein
MLVKRLTPLGDKFGGLERLLELDRAVTIVTLATPYFRLLIAVIVYSLLVGFAPDRVRSRRFYAALTVVAITIAAWFGYYLVTPYDLTWQIANSTNRLMMQLAPTLIFTLMIALRTPAEIIRRAREGAPNPLAAPPPDGQPTV